MKKFPGFTDSETFAKIPDSFFRHLLTEIDDADELKITLYALWRMGQMEGRVHFLREQDFIEDRDFMAALGGATAKSGVEVLEEALEKAAQRGSLLAAGNGPTVLYFLNSPRGRAAAEAYEQGQWQPGAAPSAPPPERPNIFKLYEENIGALTPLIADALKDAEQTYPQEWVAEALEIAVKNNKRNWKYVEAILKRWKVEGHAKKQDRRDAQEDGRRYVEGEFADYIEH
jgi:DnaD/phage-associated family protein